MITSYFYYYLRNYQFVFSFLITFPSLDFYDRSMSLSSIFEQKHKAGRKSVDFDGFVLWQVLYVAFNRIE